MSVALYMDVHVRRAVTEGLRLRGVDVLTAQEDGTTELEDSALLERVAELGRVLFTQDKDFLREAAIRQERGENFPGVIYMHTNLPSPSVAVLMTWKQSRSLANLMNLPIV